MLHIKYTYMYISLMLISDSNTQIKRLYAFSIFQHDILCFFLWYVLNNGPPSLGNLYQIGITIALFRLIWHQTGFCLLPNRSEKFTYNPNLVYINNCLHDLF